MWLGGAPCQAASLYIGRSRPTSGASWSQSWRACPLSSLLSGAWTFVSCCNHLRMCSSIAFPVLWGVLAPTQWFWTYLGWTWDTWGISWLPLLEQCPARSLRYKMMSGIWHCSEIYAKVCQHWGVGWQSIGAGKLRYLFCILSDILSLDLNAHGCILAASKCFVTFTWAIMFDLLGFPCLALSYTYWLYMTLSFVSPFLILIPVDYINEALVQPQHTSCRME